MNTRSTPLPSDPRRRLHRRAFLAEAARGLTGLGLGAGLCACSTAAARPRTGYKIALSEMSLRRALAAKQLEHLDFPRAARNDYGVDAIELASPFFQQSPQNREYMAQLKHRVDIYDLRVLLIRVDDEGALGDPDPGQRKQVVRNHRKWIEAAHALSCHSIRVNTETGGAGSREAQLRRTAESIRTLADQAADYRLNVLVENLGGLSADISWLTELVRQVNRANCGTLVNFGNFTVSPGKEYNRYRGVAEMLPWAKAVTATAYDFDEAGWETNIDYRRLLRTVLAARYFGYIAIDYQGTMVSEREGILATKRLLERLRDELTAPKPAPKRTPTDVGGRA